MTSNNHHTQRAPEIRERNKELIDELCKFGNYHDRRDELIEQAIKAGIPKSWVVDMMGVSMTVVRGIARRLEKQK